MFYVVVNYVFKVLLSVLWVYADFKHIYIVSYDIVISCSFFCLEKFKSSFRLIILTFELMM